MIIMLKTCKSSTRVIGCVERMLGGMHQRSHLPCDQQQAGNEYNKQLS